MTSDEQQVTRRGPAVLAALLLSLLLGGPSPAAPVSAPASTDVTQLQAGKATALARTPRRASQEGADVADAPTPDLGFPPTAEAAPLPLFSAVHSNAAPAFDRARTRPVPFRARAPPAA